MATPGPNAAYIDDAPPGTVRLSVEEAIEIGEGALKRIGFSKEDTDIILGQLIDNALCGYPFTSLPRILAIANDPKTKEQRRPVRVVHETPVSAMLDGGNNVGYVAVYKTAEVAIEKAKTSCFSVVGAHDSYYSGRNAYYVEKIVNAGFVTLHIACGQPHVVPPGGTRPALGTNPICIGIPSANGPFIVDLGTAALQWGEVQLHAHIDALLPDGVGVDQDGLPTRDAKEALLGGVLPFGGHKGYGLSLAVQTMGLLAGAALPRGNVQDYGFLFITFAPDLLLPGDQFAEQVAALMDAIRATPRKAG
ncbi:MAG: Ldh family oxidoreductase, partial [Alphaproteobacteria bacterium]|nr:Ldh family oxidoreductase [Alphaproteobacteria bacterium]